MLLRVRRLGTPLVLGVAVATLAALAVTARGFPVQHVSLNDGGIWVTNDSAGAIGRFAKPVAELDGEVFPPGPVQHVDVWQNGTLVVAYSAAGGKIYSVNAQVPALAGSGVPVSPVPGGIALGGSTLAVLSAGGHALRTATLQPGGGSLAALAASAPPLARDLPPNAAVAVGADGAVFVAGGGELRSFASGAGKPVVAALPLSVSDPMQVTAVGDVPVVADQAAGKLYLPVAGRTVRLPAAAGLRLQQPSGPSGVVVAATSAALYSVDLRTGQLATLSSGHSGSVVAPVQVAGCVHAAWYSGTAGSYVRSCGSPPPAATASQSFPLGNAAASLVFRVNDGAVVLNDMANGGVFLAGTTVAAIRPKWGHSDITAKGNTFAHDIAGQQAPLTAKPCTQGVRPDRTTVVHVLDADKGMRGVTYQVTAVGTPDQSQVTVAVAPDGQSVLATVGVLTADAHFQYTIDDGHGHQASATVTLVPRAPGQNGPPFLKPFYQPPALAAASGGTLSVPVIGDWRDPDGDPLYIGSGSVTASAGSASVTGGGAISFTAPRVMRTQTVTIRYGVSDGIVTRPAALKVTVEGSSSTRFVPPVAEPDAARAVAGSLLTLRPLANDLPGVDPTNPAARLMLAAPVAAVPGATVTTGLAGGTVTFTAQRPGDFFLAYTDAYGSAPTATGTIRVHVVPASGKPLPPVTTPEVAVLHGQQPATIDVLAGDSDPQGWLLGVTGAAASVPGVRVAVAGQRWLRISAGDPAPGGLGTVTYTVSDGRSGATGTVAVTAVPASGNADQIATTEAAVTVRPGDSAAVPVLNGDSSSTGLPLSLAGTPPAVPASAAGLLASVQGENIRVTAPAGVKAEEESTVSYVATDSSGATAAGLLDVTIMPPPDKAHPDQAPSPQEVDARQTAGDVTVIPVPVYGADPDGDPVAVTAVTVPPSLGRIIAVGPDSVTYQSYPGSAGTDSFTYQVTDPYGATGTAQVRIAVLPPGLPQPPVAVDDVISAPPGAVLHWNVLGNDYIAPGDAVTVEPLAKTNPTVPAGVRLAGDYVYLRVPASPSDPPVQFTYAETDGSAPSLARVVVHAVKGAQVPPIANDDIASPPPPGARAVTVGVLRNDDDPVGSPAGLKITGKPAGVTVKGGSLVIPLTAQPREVPYQVTAPDGLSATAVVYVPGTNSSAIRLKKGARITLARNGSAAVPLSSVLLDAAGRQLKITTTGQLAASPAGAVTVSATQPGAFTVHALGGYTGPGEVSVQVYDGTTLQDPAGHVATVAIPVQAGPDVPVLRCPAQPVAVAAGGAARDFGIGRLCHAWVDTTVATPAPRYTVSWARAPAGVSATVAGGTTLALSAGGAAVPGSTGVLRITPAGGAGGARLGVTVTGMPAPSASPVSVSARPGAAVTVDLRQYVTSPLAQPHISVLAVTRPAGAAVAVHGPAVTITPARTATGTISLTATVTDEPGRAGRSVAVPVTVTVAGLPPGAPGTPSATAAGGAIDVSWPPAPASGSPVLAYTVYANGTPHQCPASPCTIAPVTSGTRYTIWVTATNSFGTGPRSPSVTLTPTAAPGQVTGLATATGSGQVTLSWARAAGSPVTGYQVEPSPAVPGQPPIASAGTATSRVFGGLVNGTAYTFRVRAVNGALSGPWSAPVSAVPYGKPSAMTAPSAAGAAVPNPGSTRAITVSWTPPQDNGSAITGYTVTEYRAAGQGGPWNATATANAGAAATSTSFTVPGGTQWYEYTVTAANAAGTSPPSPRSTPPIQAIAPPGAPAGLTASDHPAGTAAGYDNAIHLSFTVPAATAAQVTSIEYGINAATQTGTFPGPFTAGTATEAITSAMTGQIANGTPVTVYLAACDSTGLCSTWTGPSNQVTPYGPPPKPNASATANGNQITYTWSGNGTNGRPLASYSVCIDGACTTDTAAGTKTITYGYNQTHNLSVTATDTTGQQSTAATATATTGATPKPAANATLSVAAGTLLYSGEGCKTCSSVHITVTSFPANSIVSYSCTSPRGFSSGNAGSVFVHGTAGTVYDTDMLGAVVKTDANGSASFDSEMVWDGWIGTESSVTCVSDNVSGTYTSPPPTLAISAGAASPARTGNCPDCYNYVHLAVTNFFPSSDYLTATCTSSNAAWPVTATIPTAPGDGASTATSNQDSAGNTAETVLDAAGPNAGTANYDSAIEWMGGFDASVGATLTCRVTDSDSGITATATYVSPTPAVTPSVSISQGQLDAVDGDNWYYVHLVLSNATANMQLYASCQSGSASWPLGPHPPGAGGSTQELTTVNAAGQAMYVDASGSAAYDIHIEWAGFTVSGATLTCSFDNNSSTPIATASFTTP